MDKAKDNLKTHPSPSKNDALTEKADSGSIAVDAMPVSVIEINGSAIITDINDAAVLELGVSRQYMLGQSFNTLFTDASPAKENLGCILYRQPVKDKEFSIEVDGKLQWLLISSFVKSDIEANGKSYLFIRNISRFKKRENLFLYLNQAASSLSQTRDTPTALRQIADFIVPSFANWFTVDVIKGDSLELTILKHEDVTKIEWAYEYRKKYPPDLNGDGGVAVVIRTGQPTFIPVVTDQMIEMAVKDTVQRQEVQKIGLHSVIMAPVWVDEKVKGIVNFISSRPDRYFDDEDLQFAVNFANLIGLSLQNTRLNDEAQREIEQRKEGEQRFRFLLDSIPHKMWTSEPDGRASYYNRQWYNYTGIEGFEALREKIWSLIHPDDLDDAMKKWPEAVATATDMEMEHRLRHFNDSYRWHLSRFNALKNDRGQVTLWVGTSTDIHDQKIHEIAIAEVNEKIIAANEELFAANEELEAANEEQMATNEELLEAHGQLRRAIQDLEEGKQRFQTFLDSIPQIAWVSSAKGEVQYYNQRWYDYTGLTFEETKNWGWRQVIHPDDLNHNLSKLTEITESGKPGEFEIREKAHDGTYRWHLVRLSPLFNAEGNLDQWIGAATDIDAIKKIQQQKDDFISIASHELKTPLTSLKSSIQLLYRMKDDPSPEKYPALIDQANRSLHKLTSLVDELLNVKRINEPQIVLEKKWFILSELVNSCSNPIAISGDVEIIIDGDKNIQVFADESAIDRVIVNLINNAVKYAPQSKQILISLAYTGEAAKLSVKDFGAGIPAEELPLIFNRYYQSGKQNYRSPGLGLGLYICSEIIKSHGGNMGVESIRGSGSTFWFTLPEVR